MVYRKTPNEQSRLDRRRDDILSAAQRIVRQYGFSAAKIRPVAVASGVSVGSVYSYFQDVETLHAEVFAACAGKELAAVEAGLATATDAAGRLRLLVQMFATRALAAPRLSWSILFEPVSPTVERQRLAYREQYVRLTAEIIERGVLTATFPPQSVLTTSRALVGAISESLVGPLNPIQTEFPQLTDAVVEDITQFCIRASGAGPHGPRIPLDDSSTPGRTAAYEGAGR